MTLDGTVIHKSGNMTGGVGSFHDSADKWDAAQVANLRSERDGYLQVPQWVCGFALAGLFLTGYCAEIGRARSAPAR